MTKKTQPLFNLRDTFEFDGEQVKVVELLESGNVHLKKIDPPYSSFIVTEGEAKGGKSSTKTFGTVWEAIGEPEPKYSKDEATGAITATFEDGSTLSTGGTIKSIVEASKEE